MPTPESVTALWRLCFCLLVLGAPSNQPTSAWAQQGTATILGEVVDRQTHAAIHGATIALVGTPFTFTSDIAGHFEHTGLVAGMYLLHVRAVGYATASWRVELADGEVRDHLFELQLASYELPELVVEGKRQRRFAEFEQRRHRGMGFFITREEIQSRNAASLTDILRTVRGVKAVCDGVGCAVRMARAPTGCAPAYFVDGFPSSAFAGAGVPLLDIQGIEIYRGASETPAEFLGTNSACGVIAIWTRSSP